MRVLGISKDIRKRDSYSGGGAIGDGMGYI